MRWVGLTEHARLVRQGEDEGICPGCGQATAKFGTIIMPQREQLGLACAECLDGETIERLDPRQNAAVLREMLRGPSGEPPPLITRLLSERQGGPDDDR